MPWNGAGSGNRLCWAWPGTPEEEFARGGLAILAVDPTVRITVIPGDPSAQRVPVESPETVIPKVITLPGGVQLPYHGTVRGTSSGYVGFTAGDGGRWQSFDAVPRHGGVDVFLGTQGGRMWEVSPGSRLLVIFLRRCIGWAWAAFELQRPLVERYGVPGPYRAILGIANTAGRRSATSVQAGRSRGHPAAGTCRRRSSRASCCWRTSHSGRTRRASRRWPCVSAPGWTWPLAAPVSGI